MITDAKGFKKLEEQDYSSAAFSDPDSAFNSNVDRVGELLEELEAGISASSSIVVSATAPADTKALWVDTGNKGALRYYNGSAWVFCPAVYGV